MILWLVQFLMYHIRLLPLILLFWYLDASTSNYLLLQMKATFHPIIHLPYIALLNWLCGGVSWSSDYSPHSWGLDEFHNLMPFCNYTNLQCLGDLMWNWFQRFDYMAISTIMARCRGITHASTYCSERQAMVCLSLRCVDTRCSETLH